MRAGAATDEIGHVVARLEEAGGRTRVSRGREATVIGAIGDREVLATLPLEAYPGVERVLPILKPYKLVSREAAADTTVVEVRGRQIGDSAFGLIAGPCTVEYREQTLETARAVAAAGATMLRGGAFKPRSSPYTFQGLGAEALAILAEARAETGLPAAEQREREARGLALAEGNPHVVLCERGIKTFERTTRYTLDLGSVAVLKHETHLPVIVDPSHAAGRRDLVLPLARAAVAVGADGIIVEAHPRPEEALCDAAQQIPTGEFAEFAAEITALVALMGKEMG